MTHSSRPPDQTVLGVGVEAIHGFMTTLMHPSSLARNAQFFEIGKAAIGFYIGKQGLESTYGAAASIVVVLIWVYYTSQIILMGAEITHSYAEHNGSLKHMA
jgi:Virulence factor BrkB